MLDGLEDAAYILSGILAAVVGATFCVRMARRHDLLHRPGFLTLLGSGAGLLVIGAGFARYLLSAVPVGIERVESCVAVFIGGLVFSGSFIAFCTRGGASAVRLAWLRLCRGRHPELRCGRVARLEPAGSRAGRASDDDGRRPA